MAGSPSGLQVPVLFKTFGCTRIAPRGGRLSGAQPQPLDIGPKGETKPSTPDQRDIYERFLSGEVLSDDDDDDFSPPKRLSPSIRR
jgi:hypothetical protein